MLLPVATSNPHTKTELQEEAAAIEEFRKELPRMKDELAQAENRGLPEAELAKTRRNLALLETELNKATPQLNPMTTLPAPGTTSRPSSASLAPAQSSGTCGNLPMSLILIGIGVLIVLGVIVIVQLRKARKAYVCSL